MANIDIEAPAADAADLRTALKNLTLPVSEGTYRRLPMWSGNMYWFPRGWITIDDVGPFLTVGRNDRGLNVPNFKPRTVPSAMTPFWNNGDDWFVADTVGCVIGAYVSARGSGYSKATPPTWTCSTSRRTGTIGASGGCIVGGGVSMSLTGGEADFPIMVEFDLSQQVAPYVAPQILLTPDTAGTALGIQYAGNEYASPRTFSGAGLNLATLTYTLVRDPRDTKTADPTITLSEGGADAVIYAYVTEMGNDLASDADPTNGATITHNGGSGATVLLRRNFYVAGLTITNAGEYRNASDNSLVSSGSWPILYYASGGTGDEFSSPRQKLGIATITSGVVTVASYDGIGPHSQRPFRAQIVPPPGITTVTPAVLTPNHYGGADYIGFTVQD